jgi:hypothetical protein
MDGCPSPTERCRISLIGGLAANPQTSMYACLALARRAGSAETTRLLLCRRDVTDEIIDAILEGDRSWTRPPAQARHAPFTWSLADQAIARLVGDLDPDVRASVASSGGLEPARARRLSADVSSEVRRAIASNTDMGEDVIRVLVADPHPEVAEAAGNRLKSRGPAPEPRASGRTFATLLSLPSRVRRACHRACVSRETSTLFSEPRPVSMRAALHD